MLVVVCVQFDSWECNVQWVWDGVFEVVQVFMVGVIDIYYCGKFQVQCDEVMCSCGLLVQILMLVVCGQGLDLCLMDGFDFDVVVWLINLLDNYVIGLMVVVGKKVVEFWLCSGKLLWEELVICDCF